jgi:hypothetical protein
LESGRYLAFGLNSISTFLSQARQGKVKEAHTYPGSIKGHCLKLGNTLVTNNRPNLQFNLAELSQSA